MIERLPLVLVVLGGAAIAIACSSDPAPIESGSSGSSGASGSTGASGSSGSSGASGGTSGSSGGGDDAAVDAPPVVDEPCAQEADCARPKTSCVLTSPGAGTCKATCTPFGTPSDCAAGATCTAHAPETAGVTQISKAAFCRMIGGTALGASCLDDPAACGANAECLFFPDKGEGIPQSRCHTLCDAGHACGSGQGDCIIKTGEAFGFCDGG